MIPGQRWSALGGGNGLGGSATHSLGIKKGAVCVDSGS